MPDYPSVESFLNCLHRIESVNILFNQETEHGAGKQI